MPYKRESLTWGSCSIAMADVGYIIRLVNGDPKFHFGTKSAKDDISIIPESVNDGVILPAANILESLWKVPVVESDLTAKENS